MYDRRDFISLAKLAVENSFMKIIEGCINYKKG